MKFVAQAAIACFLAVHVAHAQDTVRGVTLIGRYDPTDLVPLIVMPVAGANGDSISRILERDLEYSDRIRIIRSDGGALRSRDPAGGLDYTELGRLNARVALDVTLRANVMHFALHDVATRQVTNVRELSLAQPALSRPWRRSVHAASDSVVQWLTNEPGIASTRIAYVRGNALRIVDVDGAGVITLPADSLARMPAWHPDGTSLVLSTHGVGSSIFLVDASTGGSRTLVEPEPSVLLLSPTFSRDGRSVVYSRQPGVGSDLYMVPASGGKPTRLTRERYSINTSPTFGRDARQIVFMSDRLGHGELMIMDLDGTRVEVLTDYPGDKPYRSDPDWSPDGRLIAYQDRIAGSFQIRVISPAGKNPRTLTDLGENEQPSWRPTAGTSSSRRVAPECGSSGWSMSSREACVN